MEQVPGRCGAAKRAPSCPRRPRRLRAPPAPPPWGGACCVGAGLLALGESAAHAHRILVCGLKPQAPLLRGSAWVRGGGGGGRTWRPACAGSGRALIHPFLAFTVTSVPDLEVADPACRELVGGRGRTRPRLRSCVLPTHPTPGAPFPRSAVARFLEHPAQLLCRAPLCPPSPSARTPQVLPVSAVIHASVTSLRVLRENRWLPQIGEIPGGLFPKRDCLQRGQGGGRGAAERAQDARTSAGDTVTTARAAGRRGRKSPANRRVTKRWPDPDSNNFRSGDTGYPRQPTGRSQICFPTSHRAPLCANPLGCGGLGRVGAACGQGPAQAQSPDSDSVLALHTPCFLLGVQHPFCGN